jgi:regulator of sigma E protease
MSLYGFLAAVFGLALLMVVHETGHHLVARAFKMRVLRFSIGFGPAIWRHQPKGSDTVYQVALIPFLAYVQVAGMNPFEEVDPEDKGSYANATLTARILTVVAGPLANYTFASVLFFIALMIGGRQVPTTVMHVVDGGAAAKGQMKEGDEILQIGPTRIDTFDQMREIILKNANQPLEVVVKREGNPVTLTVTPEPKGDNGGGLIGVSPASTRREPVALDEAVSIAIARPAEVVYQFVVALSRIATGQEKLVLTGPIGISKDIGSAADRGLDNYLHFLAMLSAYLGGFNLLPVPALDGGRLMFLLYEGVARRKPNARIEAQIHAVGLLMFLALMVVVSVFDIRGE